MSATRTVVVVVVVAPVVPHPVVATVVVLTAGLVGRAVLRERCRAGGDGSQEQTREYRTGHRCCRDHAHCDNLLPALRENSDVPAVSEQAQQLRTGCAFPATVLNERDRAEG